MIRLQNNLYNELLNSPVAPILVEKVQKILKKEQKKRMEFREQIVTEEYKCEFINGEIIVESPVKKYHSEYCTLLCQLMNIYVTKNDLGFVGMEKIMVSLTRNDYEPDLCYFTKEKSKNFKDEQALFPAPDLVVEFLSKSTEARDRGIKFEDYQNHKVEEYWIISPDTKVVEQYHLEKNTYKLITKSDTGELQSFALKGFKIPLKAIFDKMINLKIIADLVK